MYFPDFPLSHFSNVLLLAEIGYRKGIGEEC
jgi:hypothetical protein